MNGNYFWGNSRRFNSYTEYLKKQFGGRIQKLAIDAGFTCPNRDGTRGIGGCTFCNNDAFNPSYCVPQKTVKQQIEEVIEFHRTRYRRSIGYFAYFQAYSNTYASAEKLQALYGEALSHPEIRGLIIGTRPDCINDQVLELLVNLNKRTFLVIEFGIESVKDETLRRINRGHDFASTFNAIQKTHALGIRTGGHIIIGLPGETEDDLTDEIKVLSRLPLFSIKFHQLQIIRGTKMETEYMNKPENFRLHTLGQYLELMAKILGNLNPEFIVDRIAGEVPPEYSVNKGWELRYDQVLVMFEEILRQNDLWQGKFYEL